MTAQNTAEPLGVLLNRLDGVRKQGSGFVARCPAHEDRHPSLSVTEGEDGKALVNCHAGCTTEAVVQALGLTLADLFPARDLTPRQKRAHARRKTEREVREALRHELWVLLQVNDSRISDQIILDPAPRTREVLAARRILSAFEVLYG